MTSSASQNPTQSAAAETLVIQPSIRELIPVRLQTYREGLTGHRLNLVIPFISDGVAFGGIATALRFFESLAKLYKHARIVVTHEPSSQFASEKWASWENASVSDGTRAIVFLERDSPLQVSNMDLFVATFWSTAIYVKRAIQYQSEVFPGAQRRFVYLIQDYEPHFYSGSAQHLLADATYRDNDSAIAVFNSSALAEFFRQSGFIFPTKYIYEPMLNARLLQRKEALKDCKKERLIYVYARPGGLRNGFDLIVEVLRTWVKNFDSATDWSMVSDGSPHTDVPLGRHLSLHSTGKAPLDDYAHLLARSWVGLAFVFTPGCSYAAYDPAEFGSWVITNKWKNKDPARAAKNIISLAEPTPEEVLDKLTWCCDQYQADRSAVMDGLGPVYRRAEVEFPFAADLANAWNTR